MPSLKCKMAIGSIPPPHTAAVEAKSSPRTDDPKHARMPSPENTLDKAEKDTVHTKSVEHEQPQSTDSTSAPEATTIESLTEEEDELEDVRCAQSNCQPKTDRKSVV